MTVKQFLEAYSYQADTGDDDITLYINSLEKGKRLSMHLRDWKQQPYDIIMAKIVEWRLYAGYIYSGPEIEIYI